jgi:hypothetical protein
MQRRHLFELEDLPWFPPVVRDLATDYLHFIETWVDLHRAIAPVLAGAMRATGTRHLVDLCSGGAGPIPALLAALQSEGVAATAMLTDLFPNIPAMTRASTGSDGRITFAREPVDARAVPDRLKGFRTLFNAFHHFRPDAAIEVLRDAARAGQPIGVFEVSQRTPRNLISMTLLTPIMVLASTPFMRPFRWKRLLFTYPLPLVPLTCLWDGMVSQLRAYTPSELEALGMAADPRALWRAGQVPLGALPGTVTYLLGYPSANS